MYLENSTLERLNHFYNNIYGEDIKMSSLGLRIRLQKLIYILKAEGIAFNYDFMWYIYGPYSTALADDGFLVQNGRIASHYQPTQHEKDIIEKMRRAQAILNDIDKTEMIASFLFLKKNYKTDNLALEVLESLKPRFKGKTQYVLQEWNKFAKSEFIPL